MFPRQSLRTFQFDYEHFLDQDVGIILANVRPLWLTAKRRLGASANAAQPEFPEQRALV